MHGDDMYIYKIEIHLTDLQYDEVLGNKRWIWITFGI